MEVAPDLLVPGSGKNVRVLVKELGDAYSDVTRVGGPPTPAKVA